MKRRTFLGTALVAGGSCVLGLPVQAQTYPSKPIRWIMPFPAGGPTDVIARKLAELAGPRIGQTIVVENKPGASGSIGTAEVARAAPDGYTFAIAIPDSLISAAALTKTIGYDARTDLTLLMKVCHAQPVLVGSPNMPARSMAQLLDAARKAPGSITYGTWGPGTLPHLIMNSVERVTGTRFMDVPYKGLAPVIQDLLGSTVDLAVVPPNVAIQLQERGVKPLAVGGLERTPLMPQVATMDEQGLKAPILNATLWTALVAPKGLPEDIQARWIAVLNEVVRLPEFEKFLSTVGQTLLAQTGPAFANDLNDEYGETMELIRSLGIKPA